MALVTVQRSPCGANSNSNCESPSADIHDGTSANEEENTATDNKGVSECYFAVKGAALVLPHDECLHVHRKNITSGACDIQQHLQSMLYLLHADDILKMAVKLESIHGGRTRYLVVVYHTGKYQMEESCLLGIDCNKDTTIGLVLPFWADTRITLDGDGGFSITSSGRHHIFKPVSVQAMWSALQTLHKASSKARECNYFKIGGTTHQWIEYYEKKISSDRSCLNEWHAMDDIESRRPPSPDTVRLQPTEREETERHIRTKLKELMMSVDLDEVTSKYIRTRLEEILNMNLKEYKSFIDQEMLTILGQMDSPTEIFQYLYLGSEWNASNLEELVVNGIGHILNVTREIDNFFPGMFDYQNIRVYDDESTEILHYWDKTYRYIRRAKDEGSKVLVHCKMGISRSASVVIAYVMKAYDWDLQRALDFVKTKRGCIKPNSGFLKQLEIYQGILDASKQRHNSLWRSKSETNLKAAGKPKKKDDKKQKVPEKSESLYHLTISSSLSSRPKSWSPSEAVADMLFPTHSKGLPDIYTKIKKTNEGSKSTEILSIDPSLPRVSSIKDRINELELQVSSTSDKSMKTEIKSPTSQSRSGFVFNLANQFELGSKPSSPVDEGLVMKSVSDEEIVQPVVSQTKPPVCKHHAVLVKPSLWPEDGKPTPDPSAYPLNTSRTADKNSKTHHPPLPSSKLTEESCDTVAQKGKSNEKSPNMSSAKPSHATYSSTFKPTLCISSSQGKGIFDEKSNSVSSLSFCQSVRMCSSERKIADTPPLNIDRSLNSCVPLREWNKTTEPAPPSKGPGASASKPPTRQSNLNCNDGFCVQTKGNYFYDKEDIPFTPGKVMRTKQQIEEKNLTRTTSFDSGFPFRTRSNPSTPPESEVSPGKLIRRSHSLRNDCRSTMPFYGKWYPLPALTSSAPITLKKSAQCPQSSFASLSISTPSVVEAVNRVICGTQEVLSSAIHFMPPEKKVSSMHSSSDSDFDFGSASSLPDIEAKDLTFANRSPPVQRESPVPGLVRLQCEILENKTPKTISEKCVAKKDASKIATASEQGCSLVNSDASKADDIKESGIVKRLKKEIEAKSSSEQCKKEKSAALGLPEIESLEQCDGRLGMGILHPIERQISAPSSDSSFESQPPRLRTRLSSSLGNRTTFEEPKAPPTPHRKTSLDLSFIQKRFPLNIKLSSQPTIPIIKPNSRTTFSAECKVPCELSSDHKTPSDKLLAKTNPGCIVAEIPPSSPICLPRKLRKQQGSTHPLSKLIKQRHPNPLYNTM